MIQEMFNYFDFKF